MRWLTRTIWNNGRNFKPPVAWLGGRDLLANIKYFVLFAISSGKLDIRDWMKGNVFPDPNAVGRELVSSYWKQFQIYAGSDEFWFDYIADCGDGMRATYSLGSLCLSDLVLKGKWTDTDNVSVAKWFKSLESNNADNVDLELKISLRGGNEDGRVNDTTVLKRGAFLFLGGDTTYHVADYASLANRFQQPFSWAVEDICKAAGADPKKILPRPIFGIPGNHDYYDELDGFNRQFRKPITAENSFLDRHGRNFPPQLQIPGFVRFQDSSYVALRLPFDWWLWGLDCEINRLDLRQQEFFRGVLKGGLPPAPGEKPSIPLKLIVATPEPTTVEGKRSLPDQKTAQAFADLDLTRPFLYLPAKLNNPVEFDSDLQNSRKIDRDLDLLDSDCRLDISGDTHHYSRYWGSYLDMNGALVAASYASVVSGGGGASMSPTQTDVGEIQAQARYPGKRVSSMAVNSRLFNPIYVFKGGNVYLAGALIAMFIFIAGCLDPNFSRLFDPLLWNDGRPSFDSLKFDWLHNLAIPGLMLIGQVTIIIGICYLSGLFDRLTISYDLAFNFKTNLSTSPRLKKDFGDLLAEIAAGQGRYVDGRFKITLWFTTLIVAGVGIGGPITAWIIRRYRSASAADLEEWLLLLGLVLLIAAVIAYISSRRRYQAVAKVRSDSLNARTEESLESIFHRLQPLVVQKRLDYLPFWFLLSAGSVFNLVAIIDYHSFPYEWKFGMGLCFLLGVSASIIYFVGGILFSSWLFKQSYRVEVSRYSYIPVYAINTLAVVMAAATLWTIGRGSLLDLAVDSVTILVLIGITAGCILLAIFVGMKTKNTPDYFVFGSLGLFHGLLQLAAPFIVVRVGRIEGFLAAIILVLIMIILGPAFTKLTVGTESKIEFDAKKNHFPRLLLIFIWSIFGVLMVLLPIMMRYMLSPRATGGWINDIASIHSTYGRWTGALLAALIGAILSCVWLGWYFAIALVFNGHSNEAGSTALVEDYKQFIRFRLTEDTLTGYVIGLDKVSDKLTDLSPRLIDIIHLRCPGK